MDLSILMHKIPLDKLAGVNGWQECATIVNQAKGFAVVDLRALNKLRRRDRPRANPVTSSNGVPTNYRRKGKAAVKEVLDCLHRGAQVDGVKCTTCKGNVTIKVYACAVHGKCSIATDVGVKVCLECSDRKAAVV
jgi:hypothetical protein